MSTSGDAPRSPAFGLLFYALGALVVAGFAVGWLPEVSSAHGHGIDRVIHYLLLTTGTLFLVGCVVLGRFILTYGRGEPQEGAVLSERTQLLWAVVPVLLMCIISEVGVLVMALPVFGDVYGDPAEDAYEVEVVGKQFEWLIRYAGPDGVFGEVDHEKVHDSRNPLGLVKSDAAARDDIVVRGQLHIPVDRMSIVRLRSLDVIHSFTVPLFRTKQDTLPGYTAYTQFTPEKEGTFELACAELCGLGHYRMQGTVTVQSEEDLAQWLSEQEPWL